MHDALNLGLPLLAILAGILLNRAHVRELRAEMNKRFDKVDGRFEVLEAELRYFHASPANWTGVFKR